MQSVAVAVVYTSRCECECECECECDCNRYEQTSVCDMYVYNMYVNVYLTSECILIKLYLSYPILIERMHTYLDS